MDMVTIKAGNTLYRDVAVYNDESRSAAHDLTGATLSFKVLDSPDGAVVYTGQTSVLDATHGKAAANLAASQTVGRAFSVLYGEVTLTEVSGNVSTVDDFKLVIKGRAA